MTNIFGWIGMQDEKRALKRVIEHVEKVHEVVCHLQAGIEASVQGDKTLTAERHEQCLAAEREADQIRRSLLTLLSEGLLLPADRVDLVRLVERVDLVADNANGASRMLILFDADLPSELYEPLSTFAELLVEATMRLREAIVTLYRGTVAETLEKCTEVELVEEQCDRYKASMLRRIFSMDLSAARLLMLRDLIEGMENTADKSEDAADVIRNLAVKVKR